MRILVQKVFSASVYDKEGNFEEIGEGLVCFCAFIKGDSNNNFYQICEKILSLRIFESSELESKNICLRDIGGDILLIPQFTLAANLRKGNVPDFSKGEYPPVARRLFGNFISVMNECASDQCFVKSGYFGKDMRVNVSNNGPYSLILEKD